MRIVLSTWGSAGDLFPLIPVALAAEAEGHRVHFLVPRSLGLYLRALGIRPGSLGSGAETMAVRDPDVFSSRFSGWSAWRTTWERYVAGGFPEAIAGAERALDAFQPDVVVTTTFATATRIAALSRGVRHVGLSIYPQHTRLSIGPNRRFASGYLAAVEHALGSSQHDGGHASSALAWGVDEETVWLHDRALLGSYMHPEARVVGFPYWDGAVESPGALDEAWGFISRGEPPILLTLGSFVGLHRRDVLESAIEAVTERGRRCLVVGAPRDSSVAARSGWVCAVPFTPLSTLVESCSLVIHHGGIGTTFAVLRAGRPGVVLPQAYDQFFNAQLVEQAGVGIDGARRAVGEAIDSVLRHEGSMSEATQRLRGELVEPVHAAGRALETIADKDRGG